MIKSTTKKVYRKVRKTVLIDSRDRNPVSTQSNYTVTLPKTLENVYSVTLRSAEIPFSWYFFSKNNGNTTFKTSSAGVDEIITIDDGNYTYITFAQEIQDKLNEVYGATAFNVSYNNSTNKLQITLTTASTTVDFDFTQPQEQSVCGNPTPVTSKTSCWGLGYMMGFNKQIYTLSTVPPGFSTLESAFSVQLNDGNYILMELDYMNKEDETTIDNRLSGRVDGCFAKIPISGNSGDIIFFREWCCPLNRSVMSPPLSQIRNLHVKFRNHTGRLLEFNNVDHSYTLEFELLDNNFDEYSSMDFAH